MTRRLTILSLSLALLMVALVTACGSETLETSVETDRAALVAFYHATHGLGWVNNDNWLSDEPMHRWHGVVTDADGRVVGLQMFRNNLNGVIPTVLGNLDRLTALDIANEREGPGGVGELVETTVKVFGILLAGAPHEYNYLSECIPRRLKGQLDMERSFPRDMPFCDKEGEADVNRLTLRYAIENGNLAEVRRLLSDESIDQEASFGDGALAALAVRQGAPEMLQALLDAGIQPACSSETGGLLLHRAVDEENADADMVRLLAEVCSQDLNALRGRQALYELLSSEELNDMRERGILNEQTPLSLAIENGNEDVVRVLLEAGADPNVGVSPAYDVGSHLAYAIELGEVDIVKLLLNAGADVAMADADGTPLQRAFDSGDASLVRILVDAGADTGDEGGEMLFEAVRFGNAGTVAALVEAGADVNARDGSGRSMLENAIVFSDAEVVSILVEAGADVNTRGRSGRSMLQNAITFSDAEVASILVEAGADVNARDGSGRSMLALARRLRMEEVVRILVDAGAQE